MLKWLKCIVISSGLCSGAAYADFLPPEQAFQFYAVSTSADQAELTWKIADGYYLYHEQLQVSHQQTPLKLTLPPAQAKDDPNFGLTQVYYGQVKTQIQVQPNQTFTVQWQGCAESGLCYPVQKTTIETDVDGLFPAQNTSIQAKLLNSAEQPTRLQDQINGQAAWSDDKKIQVSEPTVTEQSNLSQQSAASSNSFDMQWNNDQFFLNLLSDQSLMINLLIFLGLGVLLAFLPCSLPLIPILSSILVQKHRGYRAALIAFAFVVGMATVYAVMGFAVAQLGYSFQRWFQTPLFIGLFSLLFIAFALNLFGVFQLSLPQGILQRLDQWQQKQQGGTLLGAAFMGIIAALIVGPCMSAPLAGALLFVSQLNQPLLGMSYLFVLGLGLGLPLFIAAVFGAHYLPKPGLWMDRLKFSFGFVMLALALYFARPLFASVLYLGLLGSVLLAFAVYIVCKLLSDVKKPIAKILLLLMSLGLSYTAVLHIYQAWQHSQVSHLSTRLAWENVHTVTELQQLLAQHQGQAVIIDVYADWCVACQPIEKEVIPRSDVQAALQDILRIKLDLTHYDPSQEELLKAWQILGPPTFIFLDPEHQEIRDLRLTGTFRAEQLLKRLQHLTEKKV